MKSRPILFMPEMLNAIAEGRKTQTRRFDRRLLGLDIGDELWCKEGLVRNERRQGCVEWVGDIPIQVMGRLSSWAKYERDKVDVKIHGGRLPWRWDRQSISPMFMPREAARVLLRVVSKPRLEVVRHISADDAMAEGVVQGSIPPDEDGPWRIGFVLGRDDGMCVLYPSPQEAFFAGWNAIHPGKGLDVEVVVVSFEVAGCGR